MNNKTRLSLLVLLLSASVSPAVTADGVARLPSSVWVAIGSVNAVASRGTTVFLAGSFSAIAQRTGPLAVLTGETGQPDSTFPHISGGDPLNVRAIARDGYGGYIVSGNFVRVGAVTRRGLARIASDGTLDPTFAPDVLWGGPVTVVGNGVFARAWMRLTGLAEVAVFDLFTGNRLPFTPALNLSMPVEKLYTGPSGSILVHDGLMLMSLDAQNGERRWQVRGPLAVVSDMTRPLSSILIYAASIFRPARV